MTQAQQLYIRPRVAIRRTRRATRRCNGLSTAFVLSWKDQTVLRIQTSLLLERGPLPPFPTVQSLAGFPSTMVALTDDLPIRCKLPSPESLAFQADRSPLTSLIDDIL